MQLIKIGNVRDCQYQKIKNHSRRLSRISSSVSNVSSSVCIIHVKWIYARFQINDRKNGFDETFDGFDETFDG
ncbi:MAG: hypothetical protein ACW9XB_02190 [Candidatus Nitrosopumilus sp. metabat.KBP569_Feb_25m_nospike.7]|nr:hypothetical protein [Nitrosopumilus sp.]